MCQLINYNVQLEFKCTEELEFANHFTYIKTMKIYIDISSYVVYTQSWIVTVYDSLLAAKKKFITKPNEITLKCSFHSTYTRIIVDYYFAFVGRHDIHNFLQYALWLWHQFCEYGACEYAEGGECVWCVKGYLQNKLTGNKPSTRITQIKEPPFSFFILY